MMLKKKTHVSPASVGGSRPAQLINLDRMREVLGWRRSYWPQTTDFTCGPSCLLMAAKLMGVKRTFRQLDEYLIWRRANTLFMGEGQAGCSAAGLGLSALRMGLMARIVQKGVLELFSVECGMRDEHVALMTALVIDDRKHFKQLGGQMVSRQPVARDVWEACASGAAVLVLVRADDGVLHWVVAVGVRGQDVYLLDPWATDRDMPDEPMPQTLEALDTLMQHGKQGCILIVENG
ncbi:MAG: hypothetical protein COY40_04255 [Alphaproteobacteria bacterium CG_4_10_14_0_8_um_filter_53_9]|nr:MAG: hypothetical protein COY40_04255 [Alphaproteobacteria bacterium CG_4_10_14_0_8_um_filter_53_9]